jgi:hypothetical protein
VDMVVGWEYCDVICEDERSSKELEDIVDILVESEGISGVVEYIILIRLIGWSGGEDGILGLLVPVAAEFFTNFNLMTV